ncbi:MAG: hypothetical protein A2V99_17745 [Spirochaetes bacterium RBG_16_67_19]|nr:MAG: hypothetical protein A2V99_17745 [Spirochaetes bacterium RBG_16_67_19]
MYSASGPGGESTGLVVQGASLALADALTLKLDMEYNAAPLSLRFAGSLKLPVGGVEVDAAGKLTDDGGKPSVGLFAIAKNLPPIPVAPAVFMNEIGGGFFINPTASDITMVQSLAQFQKPEMNDELQDRLPGGKKSSSTSFALMVLGGFYVSAESLLSGRALLTLTGGYLDLQAEAQAAGGLADGRGSLTISWKPWYGEGSLSVAVGFPSSGAIVSGKGDASFYVYEGVWGVTGKVSLSLLGGSLGQTELFLGTPGFMVQAGLSRSIDLYIISGSLTLKGMFWYYAPKDNIGAYASIEADGDFLGGLFSASAGLEGALIVNPGVFLYAVGHVSAEALGVTLYSGSVWVSLGSGGLDGGKGRNHQYDQMIADAKGMAAALKQAKQALIASLQDAKLKLAELDAESRKVAGLALVEQQQSIFYGFPVDWIFAQAEVGNWAPGGLPPPIKTSYDRLFGAAAKSLVAQHKTLTAKLDQFNTELAGLEKLRQQVSTRLAQYEDILLADLPAVAELGTLGSPFQGWQEKTVQVAGQSAKVTSGFALDQAKAEKQADTLAGLREQFAAYQDAFIQQAGTLDGRLRSLDEILFQGEDCLTRLSERFAGIHSELSFFTDGFVDFLGANAAHAGQSYTAVDPLEAQISQALTAKAQAMLKPSPQALKSWISTRADIIEELLNVGKTQGQAKTEYPVHPFEAGADLEGLFLKTGLELWYELPLAGWNQSIIKALVQVGQSVETFRASAMVLWAGWGQSTALVEQVYSRKAELYDLLYEIYDQLSIYGSGQIGVAASGNAAGFAGWAAAGLSFRTGEMASAVKAQALPLPPGAQPPPKPTFGPNRPLQFLEGGPLSGGAPGAGYPLPPPQPRPLESRPLPGIAAGTFSLFTGLGSIQLKETGASLPSKGGYQNLDSSAAPKLPALPPMAWVPVTGYFQGKRAEIAPYLEVPQVTQLSATLASQSPLEALLEAQVAGSHPVAVVEYEYRIERALSGGSGPQVQGPYGGFFYQGPPKPPVQKPLGLGPPVQFLPVQATGQLAPLAAPSSPGQAQVVLKPTPWLSLGSLQQFSHLFLPELNEPGTFRLLVKLRGAGGKSIVRQGTFQVGYAQQTSKPFSSALDASDKSAPTVPVVGLQGAATSGKQILYAQWQSQDPESGIQSYAYAVEPDTAAGGQAAAQKASGKKSGVTSTMEFLQSGAFSQLAADAPIVAGSGWVNAGGRTEANIRQLDLQQGQQYVVKVRATNGVGLSSVGSSAPILVDATGPVAPQIQSFQQTQADGKANSVAFSIVPASDPESGISGHSFALGHSEKDEAVFPWTALQGTTATVVNLPLPEGEQVVLKVRALNGASTPAEASAALTLHYPDSSPPSKPSVLTQPANFSSDTGKIAISWSAAQDPDSGVLFYEYGLGSIPDLQDVLPWSPVPGASTAYLLGQAPQSTAAYSATAAAPLKDKQSYYAQVRSTNGVGLRSLASSLPVLIDLSPPLASLSAPAENKGRITLKLDLQASDAQSGVAEYRVLVWPVESPLSTLPGALPGGAWALPAAGWSMPGTLQGSFQLKGQSGSGGPAFKLAPMPQGKPPWFASGWKKLSAGAPPQSLDVELLVSGFPDKGLQYGQSYTVAVEVRNGAGGVGVSNPAVVKVVPPPQGYQMTPKFSF